MVGVDRQFRIAFLRPECGSHSHLAGTFRAQTGAAVVVIVIFGERRRTVHLLIKSPEGEEGTAKRLPVGQNGRCEAAEVLRGRFGGCVIEELLANY